MINKTRVWKALSYLKGTEWQLNHGELSEFTRKYCLLELRNAITLLEGTTYKGAV